MTTINIDHLTTALIDDIEQGLNNERKLTKEFVHYIFDACDEIFEDGVNSNFSRHVHQSIIDHGQIAVYVWSRALFRLGNAFEIGEEILRQYGSMDHEPTYVCRLRALEDNLNHCEPVIRDAAGIGLSLLEDPSTLPALKKAHASENVAWVKKNLEQVIEQYSGI